MSITSSTHTTDEDTIVTVDVIKADSDVFESVVVYAAAKDSESVILVSASGTMALSAARLACRSAGMDRKSAAKLVTLAANAK